MNDSYFVIEKLIERYDYGGALEVLVNNELENTDLGILLDSCRHAVNFDFETSRFLLNHLSEESKKREEVKFLLKNLRELIEGDPVAIFSELIENIKFQIVNEEYIDFLGRVYRFKEAIFKYLFVQRNLKKEKFSFHLNAMSKRDILKVLRKQYKIFNSNLIFGITTYVNKYVPKEDKCFKVVKMLNSEKMMNLIELRNSSIVGHGFVGVGANEIYKLYGNPYNVIDDFNDCLSCMEIKTIKNKYLKLNDYMMEELKKISALGDVDMAIETVVSVEVERLPVDNMKVESSDADEFHKQ